MAIERGSIQAAAECYANLEKVRLWMFEDYVLTAKPLDESKTKGTLRMCFQK